MRHTIRNSPRGLKRLLVLLFFCGLLRTATANDWKEPTQQLARKIVAVTGPGAGAVTVENRSSLAKKDSDTITSALHVDLEALGARSARPEQAAASAAVWLSENPQFYVWVAQVQQGAEATVVMVSVPRGDEAGFAHESMPMSLRKIPLWSQEDRILDVAILEEDSAPKEIAVLDGDRVAIYRLKNSKWQQEQSLGVAHARPWPKDLRGRVFAAKDHLLDVYLPGVFCRSTTGLPLTLSCLESDDPWPLVATAAVGFPASGGAASRGILLGVAKFLYRSPGTGHWKTYNGGQVLFGGSTAAAELCAVALRRDGRTSSSGGWNHRPGGEAWLGQRYCQRKNGVRIRMAGACGWCIGR